MNQDREKYHAPGTSDKTGCDLSHHFFPNTDVSSTFFRYLILEIPEHSVNLMPGCVLCPGIVDQKLANHRNDFFKPVNSTVHAWHLNALLSRMLFCFVQHPQCEHPNLLLVFPLGQQELFKFQQRALPGFVGMSPGPHYGSQCERLLYFRSHSSPNTGASGMCRFMTSSSSANVGGLSSMVPLARSTHRATYKYPSSNSLISFEWITVTIGIVVLGLFQFFKNFCQG